MATTRTHNKKYKLAEQAMLTGGPWNRQGTRDRRLMQLRAMHGLTQDQLIDLMASLNMLARGLSGTGCEHVGS